MKTRIRICLVSLFVALHTYAAEFDLGTNGVLSITLPEGWKSQGRVSRKPDGTEKGYDILIQPTNSLDAKCLLNFGYVMNGAPDKAALKKQLSEMAEGLVSKSVEKQVNLKEFSLENGQGVYCLFTDAALAGKSVPKGEHRVMGVGLFQPANDILGVVSMLANEKDGEEMKAMIKMINSVKLTKTNSEK